MNKRSAFYRLNGNMWFLKDASTLERGGVISNDYQTLRIDQWDDGLPKVGSEYGIPVTHKGATIGVTPPKTKLSNPKEAMGSNKISFSVLPANVLGECALALTEGAMKYGRHNYRGVGVRASTYYDAALRHLMAWWEGEDIDPESGLSHVTKAISGLMVVRDCMMADRLNDDRPPKSSENWMADLNKQVPIIRELYKDKNPKHYYAKENNECN